MASKPEDQNQPNLDPTGAAASNDQQEQQQPKRNVVDRRAGLDRRQKSRDQAGYSGSERRSGNERDGRRTGLERRRGAGIRRPEDRKAAEEGEMTVEQFEFVMAIETYKKVNKKMFPTWTEVLEVIQQLGYRKIEHRTIVLESVPEPTLHRLAA
jgi:hypothetical protein